MGKQLEERSFPMDSIITSLLATENRIESTELPDSPRSINIIISELQNFSSINNRVFHTSRQHSTEYSLCDILFADSGIPHGRKEKKTEQKSQNGNIYPCILSGIYECYKCYDGSENSEKKIYLTDRGTYHTKKNI